MKRLGKESLVSTLERSIENVTTEPEGKLNDSRIFTRGRITKTPPSNTLCKENYNLVISNLDFRFLNQSASRPTVFS